MVCDREVNLCCYVPGNARDQVKIARVGESHFFVIKLFEAIYLLGLGGPGIRLFESRVVWVRLLVLVIHAGGGRVKVALGATAAGGLQHIGRHQSVVPHEDGLVGFNETHAPHVRREIVHVLAAIADLNAMVELAQIDFEELVAKIAFGHKFISLPVGYYHIVAIALETTVARALLG